MDFPKLALNSETIVFSETGKQNSETSKAIFGNWKAIFGNSVSSLLKLSLLKVITLIL